MIRKWRVQKIGDTWVVWETRSDKPNFIYYKGVFSTAAESCKFIETMPPPTMGIYKYLSGEITYEPCFSVREGT